MDRSRNTHVLSLALLALSGCSQDWSNPQDNDASTTDGGTMDGGVNGGEGGTNNGGEGGTNNGGEGGTNNGAEGGTNNGGEGGISNDAEAGTPANNCAGNHGCAAEYPCEELPGGYTCAGQGVDFPLPKRAPGIAEPTESQLGWQVSASGATVLDTLTGLRWQKGTSPDGYTNKQAAAAYCENLNATNYEGYKGWRLPSLLELWSLIQTDTLSRSNAFNAIFTTENLWTSSPNPQPATRVPAYFWTYSVDHSSYDSTIVDHDKVYARCVRREESKCSLPLHKRFAVDAEVVRDECTKLTWQRTPLNELRSYADAAAYCRDTVKIGGRTWRLPTFSELYSLVDYTLNAANTYASALHGGFSVKADGHYVTSTTAPKSDPSAPVYHSYVRGDGRWQSQQWLPTEDTGRSFVRCVSDGL